MNSDSTSPERQIEDIFREPNRGPLIRTEAIPELAAQIARAREHAPAKAVDVRARADQVLEELARIYSSRSTAT